MVEVLSVYVKEPNFYWKHDRDIIISDPERQILHNTFVPCSDDWLFSSVNVNTLLLYNSKKRQLSKELGRDKSIGLTIAGMLYKPLLCGVDSAGNVLISNEGMPLQIMSPEGKFTLTSISCDERIKFVKLCGKSLYILTETHLRVIKNFIE